MVSTKIFLEKTSINGGGIIGISLGQLSLRCALAIERSKVGGVIQGLAVLNSLDQIGVSDPRYSESDEIRFAFFDILVRFFGSETAIGQNLGRGGDQRTVSSNGVVVGTPISGVEEGRPPDEGDVGKVQLVGLRDEVLVGFKSLFEGHSTPKMVSYRRLCDKGNDIPHIVVASSWAQFNSNTVCTENFGENSEDLQAETSTVLH